MDGKKIFYIRKNSIDQIVLMLQFSWVSTFEFMIDLCKLLKSLLIKRSEQIFYEGCKNLVKFGNKVNCKRSLFVNKIPKSSLYLYMKFPMNQDPVFEIRSNEQLLLFYVGHKVHFLNPDCMYKLGIKYPKIEQIQ